MTTATINERIAAVIQRLTPAQIAALSLFIDGIEIGLGKPEESWKNRTNDKKTKTGETKMDSKRDEFIWAIDRAVRDGKNSASLNYEKDGVKATIKATTEDVSLFDGTGNNFKLSVKISYNGRKKAINVSRARLFKSSFDRAVRTMTGWADFDLDYFDLFFAGSKRHVGEGENVHLALIY